MNLILCKYVNLRVSDLEPTTRNFVFHRKDHKCGENEFVLSCSGGEEFFRKSMRSKQHLNQSVLILRVYSNFVMEIGLKVLLCGFEIVDLQKKRSSPSLWARKSSDRPTQYLKSQKLAGVQKRLHYPTLRQYLLHVNVHENRKV